MSSQFIVKKGLIVQSGDAVVSRSLFVERNIIAQSFTGSVSGSITYANFSGVSNQSTSSISSSYASTSSWAVNWNSSSLVSLINTKQNILGTGSTYPITSSWALNLVSGAIVGTASHALYAEMAGTASYAELSRTASYFNQKWLITGSTYLITSSWAVNWNSSSVITLIGTKQNTLGTGSTYPFTSSWSVNSTISNDLSSKGSLVAGSNISLVGTGSNRLVGSGDITISSIGSGMLTGSGYPITSSWSTNSTNVDILSTITNANYRVPFVDGVGIQQLRSDNTTNHFQYNPSTNILTVGGVVSNLTGSVQGTSSWSDSSINAITASDLSSKGSLVAGSNISLSGTITNRLVGSGNITINSIGLSTGSTYPFTSSWSVNATNWNSASVITLIGTKQNQLGTGSTYPFTSSHSLSASYVAGATPTFTGKSDNYFPKWSSNALTDNSLLYDDGIGVAIGVNGSQGARLFISSSNADFNSGIAIASPAISSLRMYVTGSPSNTGVIGRFNVPAILISSDGVVSLPNGAIGSLEGTASWATNWNSSSVVSLINTKQNIIGTGSTYPITSSWATNVNTASYISGSIEFDSNIVYPITSSHALTASYAAGATPTFTGKSDNYIPKWDTNTLTGTSNLYDGGPMAAVCIGTNAFTASGKLVVSGSADGVGGLTLLASPNLTMRLFITGSPTSTGIIARGITPAILIDASSNVEIANSLTSANTTGSLFGTSSWATNVVNSGTSLTTGSTYPITSSWAVNWNSSSVITLINTKQNTLGTGSTYPFTSSWATNSLTASRVGVTTAVDNTDYSVVFSPTTTGTHALLMDDAQLRFNPALDRLTVTRITSSLFGTASWATNWNSSSVITLINTKQNTLGTGSTYPFTASWATNVVNDKDTWLTTGSLYPITSSHSLSASYVAGATPTFTGMTDNYVPKWSSNTLTGTSNIVDSGPTTAVCIGVNAFYTSGKLVVSGSADGAGGLTLLASPNLTMRLYVTGSPSNTGVIARGITPAILVDASSNVEIAGRLTSTNTTGSLFGTASWATNAVNWNSSSIITLIGTKQNTLGTGSTYPFTSSWATNVVGGGGGGLTTGSTYPITSSWAINSRTSSFIHNASTGIPVISTNTRVDWDSSDNSIQLGKLAGFYVAHASHSVLIGYAPAWNSLTASNATIIGWSAGGNAKQALNATMIGRGAGMSAATGSNSTFIGALADAATDTTNVEKSIAIGFNAKVAGPNMCVIGGTGADAVNVGINTSNPLTRLHIDHGPVVTGHGEGFRLRNTGSNESWVLSSGIIGNDRSFGVKRVLSGLVPLVVSASGNVGIGITNPSNTLHVGGNITAVGLTGSLSGYVFYPNDALTRYGWLTATGTGTYTTATALGFYAGYNATSLVQGVAVGAYAGDNAASLLGGTSIGYAAGQNATASYSVCIGYDAGRNASGSNSIFIGRGSGANAKKGDSFTLVGALAGATAETISLDKSIAIGYNARVGGPNMCVIGGTGADAVNVGIGVTNPSSTLQVAGNVTATSFTGSLLGTAATASYITGSIEFDKNIVYPITASWAVNAVSGGGSSVTIYTSPLSANVNMASADTWYTGSSLTLDSGKYIVNGIITCESDAAYIYNPVCARLVEGGTTRMSGLSPTAVKNISTVIGSVHLSSHLDLSSTTTIRMVALLIGYSGTIVTSSYAFPSASMLYATKIG